MNATGNGKAKRRTKTTSTLDKAIDAVVSAGTSFTKMVKETLSPSKPRRRVAMAKAGSPRRRRAAA